MGVRVSSQFMRNEPFMRSFLEVGLGWHSHESVGVGDLDPRRSTGPETSTLASRPLWDTVSCSGSHSEGVCSLAHSDIWLMKYFERSLWCWHWTQPLYSDTAQGHWDRNQCSVYELIWGECAGWSSSPSASSWDWSSEPLLQLKVIKFFI